MKNFGHNLTNTELQEMIDAVDEDGNNEIDFDEWCVMMQSVHKDRNEELREAFAVFDVDGGGTTSKEELMEIMVRFAQNLSDEELTAVMDEVDADGSGEIDFDE